MRKPSRSAELADAVRRLRTAVLDGAALTPAAQRHAAYEGASTEATLDAYLSLVREQAYRITDSDIAALRKQGLSDDGIFEVTVAAALGAADKRLAAGLALLDPDVAR